MNRILVADDHPMIQAALEMLLRGTGREIVGTAGTVESTLEEIDKLKPDLLLLDLQMPGGSGMDVLRSVRAARKRLRVVILTAGIEDSALLEAKALKVDGIVLKNRDPAFLIDCLDRVGHGRSWVDPELAERLRQLARPVEPGARPALAPRELQVIGLVRRGLRNREIAQRLGVTEGTVKAYLHAIFDKLGVSSRTELATRADEFLA